MKNQIMKSIMRLVLSATLLIGSVSLVLAAETSVEPVETVEVTKTEELLFMIVV